MKKLTIFGTSIALLVWIGGMASAANTAGSACTKAGTTIKVGSSTLRCSLVWVAQGSPTATPTPTQTTQDSGSMQSKSFKLVSIAFNDNGYGGQASARMTNTSNKSKTALFTLTFFAADKKTIAGTMMGSAEKVLPGETVTVNFVGTASLPSGPFTYTFQTDLEY